MPIMLILLGIIFFAYILLYPLKLFQMKQGPMWAGILFIIASGGAGLLLIMLLIAWGAKQRKERSACLR